MPFQGLESLQGRQAPDKLARAARRTPSSRRASRGVAAKTRVLLRKSSMGSPKWRFLYVFWCLVSVPGPPQIRFGRSTLAQNFEAALTCRCHLGLQGTSKSPPVTHISVGQNQYHFGIGEFTTRFRTYFRWGLGCSLGVPAFDPWPYLDSGRAGSLSEAFHAQNWGYRHLLLPTSGHDRCVACRQCMLRAFAWGGGGRVL